MRLSAVLTLAVLAAANFAEAQQPPCTVVANVVAEVVRPLWPLPDGTKVYQPESWIPLRNLPPDAFVVRDGRRRVPVLSVEQNSGPRRIVVVIAYPGARAYERIRAGTAGSSAPQEQTPDLVDTQVTAIASLARPEDSLALLTTGESRLEVPLGSSRDALRAGIAAFFHPHADGPAGPDVFSGLAEAITWFGTPQTGDSIFLLGGIRPWDRAKGADLRSALVSRGIRLFILGTAGFEITPCTTCLGSFLTPDALLSEQTGGGFEMTGYLGPHASDDNLRLWQSEAKALYDMATAAYVLRLERTGPALRVELSPKIRGRLEAARVHYATPVPVCPPPTAPAPARGKKTE